MIKVALTGSIAMGKTETAKMFAALGIPIFDADAEVHRLYGKGGEAVRVIAQRFPAAIVDSEIDRTSLAKIVLEKPENLAALEALVHPLVRRAQEEFLETCRQREEPIAMVDIPLLFETGREGEFDKIVVASAPSQLQEERALRRPGMTKEKLTRFLARQIPDEEKRKRADFVVDTSRGYDDAREQVRRIVDELKSMVLRAER